jgi:hypothetical protein
VGFGGFSQSNLKQIPLCPPEAVKKFRQRKMGGPRDVRERLFPPSICIFSPLPLFKGGLNAEAYYSSLDGYKIPFKALPPSP